MNDRLRRILLAAAFVAVVILIFWLIWYVFFRPTAVEPVNNAPGNINGLPPTGNRNAIVNGVIGNVNALPIINGLPGGQEPTTIAQGGPTFTETVVTDQSSELTFAGLTNTLRYYDRSSGKFFELSPDGTTKNVLSDAVYRDVSDISWSPDGGKAILAFPDGSKVLYDFALKKQTTLPKELNDFSFSPQSDQVVSKFLNGRNADDQWLMVSQPDGSSSSAVEHLGENARYVQPAWSPNNQIIATYEKSSSADLSEIIFLGAKGENFRSATIEGRGFTPKWSPDGRKILYSSYSANTDDNPRLYLMNGSPDTIGTNLVDLGLDTTADKCVFSPTGTSIFCAVPYYLNSGSGPQPELSAGIPDNIYRIDLLSGSSELIARPIDGNLNQRYSATNLQLSPNEDAIFFVDASTGQVVKIRLR